MEDKESIQKTWDLLLIKCWRHHCDYNNLLYRFFDLIGEWEFFKSASVDDLWVFMNYLNLRRAKKWPKAHEALPMNMPVRSIVSDCSPHLNNCLLAGVATDDEILEAMDGFRWVVRPPSKREGARARSRRDVEMDVVIKMREIKNKHDWGTVG